MAFLQRRKYRKLNDEDLINEIRADHANEQFAIAELYERYGHLVMGTSMKYLKNVMDAEDITMNIFETLANKIRSHEIKYFKSWLYMVTKNTCLMKLRKKGLETTELGGNEAFQEEDSEVEKKEELLNMLERVLDELKEPQQSCVKLFYLEQLSYQEIAQRLNLELKKVKSAIQNGKRNITLRMTENGG